MGRNISNEQPPVSTDDDLKEWLARRMVELNIAFGQIEDYDVLYQIPEKNFVGMVKYFGAAIPTTAITAEGLWCYKSTGWTQIV